jgi:hypothetical protein
MALFVAELLQGTGQAMNIKWVIEGSSLTGPFCTAQGAVEVFLLCSAWKSDFISGTISQIGEPYVALATMVSIYDLHFAYLGYTNVLTD